MLERTWRRAAWGWAGVLLLLAAALALAAGTGRVRLNTDVLAMLPKDERRPEVERALGQLAKAGDGRVVVLVQADDGGAAADRLAAALRAQAPQAVVRDRVPDDQASAWLSFFAPYPGALLTDGQRRQLEQGDRAALGAQALASLLQPLGLPRVVPWREDPFNTLGAWLAQRASQNAVRVEAGRLLLKSADGVWALVMVEGTGSAFALADNEHLAAAVAAGRAAAAPARVMAAGVPLHAHAAAAQAQREMHAIAAASLVGVFLLSWLAFARVRPRLLVLLSVGSGLLCAVALTVAVFGELHLITLVFGATLVGVAENYASSYYAARVGRAAADRWAVMREQLPPMGLALSTTLAGYLLLAGTPFPGLQQVAVFSAAGLVAAFVSTVLWFPFLDRGEVPPRPLMRGLSRVWAAWPVGSWWMGLPLAALLVVGLLRVQANDDIRLLQSTPPELMRDQVELGRRLDLPNLAQFYLLEAASAEALLQREEALKARLQPLVDQGLIRGWQAVSDWVPSAARQASDRALVAQRWAEVRPALEAQLDQTLSAAAPRGDAWLTVEAWRAAPVSETARHQWLGPDAQGHWHSVLLLRGASAAAQPRLARLAQDSDGAEGVERAASGSAVRWVDKVGEVSTLLARQRVRMGVVLALAVGAVALLLAWRFGRQAWRAWVPTVLAGAGAVALLAAWGAPLQLFHVLALLLLLGVGVDYGIFLLAQPDRRDGRSFLSVTLAAACTWLSFGLLALSATPALQAFGWTLGLGVLLAWFFTPFFIPRERRL
ncbi:MMPL family transporter [Inhella gelatinilytica]|uniref:MMPL family transporter n=1 Tax=Inhella gelatinilytica TaxID=2795030 RepID=A0A931NCU8_9BURK|nr:MMPL family transporter [Inhella gelatinilytica]MBH9551600.1 MMPL family transporter [Inhella gelatinilytica]